MQFKIQDKKPVTAPTPGMTRVSIGLKVKTQVKAGHGGCNGSSSAE